MTDLFQTAAHLQEFCDTQGWKSCFIGGIAVLRWGEPRVTRDVDLSLLTGFGDEESFIRILLRQYKGRMHDAAAFASRYRILLLQSADEVGIDISLAALPFEEQAVARASGFRVDAAHPEIRTCSAEDLVVLKLFASRPLDIRDVEGVVARCHDSLDWTLIERELTPLAEAKGDSRIMAEFQRVRKL